MPEDYAHLKTAFHFLLWDHEAVITEATKALALYPEGRFMVEFRYFLAQAYDYSGKLDKAVKAYDDIADRYAGSADPQERIYDNSAITRCGVILMGAGRNEEAIIRFQRAIKEFPGTVWTQSAAERLKVLQGGNEKTN
jgi:tetratricopeptide (TPR) repeat protein